jgi:hypothetical protein
MYARHVHEENDTVITERQSIFRLPKCLVSCEYGIDAELAEEETCKRHLLLAKNLYPT